VNYYYAEINSNLVANGTIEHTWQWLENVSTVAGAKSAATRRQLFQGTTLLIGVLTASDPSHRYGKAGKDADPTIILVKRAHPIDMSQPGRWRRLVYKYTHVGGPFLRRSKRGDYATGFADIALDSIL
jgi:hypothetical protein